MAVLCFNMQSGAENTQINVELISFLTRQQRKTSSCSFPSNVCLRLSVLTKFRGFRGRQFTRVPCYDSSRAQNEAVCLARLCLSLCTVASERLANLYFYRCSSFECASPGWRTKREQVLTLSGSLWRRLLVAKTEQTRKNSSVSRTTESC